MERFNTLGMIKDAKVRLGMFKYAYDNGRFSTARDD